MNVEGNFQQNGYVRGDGLTPRAGGEQENDSVTESMAFAVPGQS